ncbi:MAG TPA: exodeoxyribonuclease VII large subunit [Candidatus Acidoferrales bacterium]|nr:exodeoxyribonuclease VII large subunit [Candidatus Acidoferrales bacterium]
MRSLFDAPAISVGELCRRIRRALASQFPGPVRVVGEISKCYRAGGGNVYFSLKDREGLIDCVCFESDVRRLQTKLPLEDGVAVEVAGFVQIYDRKSAYQLRVTDIVPFGLGAMHVASERLKARLAELGLFAQERKRPIPSFITAVAIVTSPDAAVLSDFITTCRRRGAYVKIRIVPAPVQGIAAAPGLVRAIRAAGRLPVDVIVVARGGGSPEDLWAFNTEEVALAIAGSPLPVISAVGHEIDHTIADLVADLRAPTATAAAEFVAAERAALLERIGIAQARLQRALSRATKAPLAELARAGARLSRAAISVVASRRQQLDELHGALARKDPKTKIAGWRERARRAAARLPLVGARALLAKRAAAGAADRDLERGVLRALAARTGPLEVLDARLQALAPRRTLARGYAIVYDAEGRVLTSSSGARIGERIGVELKSGSLGAQVTEKDVYGKDEREAD